MSGDSQRKTRGERPGSSSGNCNFSDLSSRLDRYGVAHRRTLDMGKFILHSVRGSTTRSDRILSDLAWRLYACGHRLYFRHYYQTDDLRLYRANFCKKPLLCPLCAIRRASKTLDVLAPKVELLIDQQTALQPFLVTLTVKDDPDLHLAYKKLSTGLKRLLEARRNYAKGGRHPFVESVKAAGGIYSIEIKRGMNSGQWHPHAHMVWLCATPPDQKRLADEWLRWTGDSFIVDVRPFDQVKPLAENLMEVVKYALKFSDLSLADNFEAYNLLAGSRLIATFGDLRGLQIPQELTDDIEDMAGLPYIDLIYKFLGTGYTLEESSRSVDPDHADFLDRHPDNSPRRFKWEK